MHAGLSVSSIIFHIPKVRIKEGSRIWPEFRLHSIVFACRSLACMSIVWYEERFASGPHYLANVGFASFTSTPQLLRCARCGKPLPLYPQVVVIFATLIAADISTNSVDEKSRSNTIRGLETSALYKYSFSLLQARASSSARALWEQCACLLGATGAAGGALRRTAAANSLGCTCPLAR